MKKIVVFGNNNIAKYLFYESQKIGDKFTIEAFCIDREFSTDESQFCGKPLIYFDQVLEKYPPEKYDMISSVITSSNANNIMLIYNKLKNIGYDLCNFVSPMANIGYDVMLGHNNIICQFAVIDWEVKIGNANFFRPFSFIGHNSVVGNANRFYAGATIGGYCKIGNTCKFAMNCNVADGVTMSDGTMVESQ